MTTSFRIRFLSIALAAALLGMAGERPVSGEEKPVQKSGDEKPVPKSGNAWTLEEAMEALGANPRDPYLQYVTLQLARRQWGNEKIEEVERITKRDSRTRSRDRERVDLFNLFSGALAVQESLQLESMQSVPTPFEIAERTLPPGALRKRFVREEVEERVRVTHQQLDGSHYTEWVPVKVNRMKRVPCPNFTYTLASTCGVMSAPLAPAPLNAAAGIAADSLRDRSKHE